MELLKKSVKHISGIYKITNRINNKFYIGSAFNLNQRYNRHKRELTLNIHSNKKLQNSVNKYEIKNFTFEILATCPKEYCIKLEQWFIDNLKPTLNNSPTAGNNFGCRYNRRSNLTDIQIINILQDYSLLSISDISNNYGIKESIIKSLIFKPKIAQDIKKDINFKLTENRKEIKGLNNKQQRFSSDNIVKIAELYNNGKQPKYIALELFNEEKLRFAITKLAKGVSYKEYYHLFNKEISYHGKQKQN